MFFLLAWASLELIFEERSMLVPIGPEWKSVPYKPK